MSVSVSMCYVYGGAIPGCGTQMCVYVLCVEVKDPNLGQMCGFSLCGNHYGATGQLCG